MAGFNKVDEFVNQIAQGAHNLASGQLVLALTAVDPTGDSNLVDVTEIDYTNLSSRAVTTNSSGQTGGLYKLVCADLTLTASGGPVQPFRWVVMYNDSHSTDGLIGYWDYGTELTLLDGESLNVDFDDANGVLNLQ